MTPTEFHAFSLKYLYSQSGFFDKPSHVSSLKVKNTNPSESETWILKQKNWSDNQR